jgi:geranylgeranyl diphosphate synthase type I
MSWLKEVRSAVDARLGSFFETRRDEVKRSAPDALPIFEGLVDLTMRGGKRLRPAVLVAAQRAVDPNAPLSLVVDACAALEVLQSYLLIHDDWMDGDEERRGGPSVHMILRRGLQTTNHPQASDHLGDSLAVLSGDLGSAYANELLLGSALHSKRGIDATRAFMATQCDVVLGQTLDLLGSHDVTRMQQLKTGSYTVDGPLVMGALLANGSDAQVACLRAYGLPLGEAFQMRDDLLGTFGDTAKTGKPVGNDLRVGKRTALVRECELTVPVEQRSALTRVFGNAAATDADVRAAMSLLIETGVRARVETRLRGLVDEAKSKLDANLLAPQGIALLEELAELLGARDY